jgi:hypothetical protein
VTLVRQGIPLLGMPVFDICGLRGNLVTVGDGYLSTGRGEESFPDEPAPTIRGGALVTLGHNKAPVEPVSFCRELLNDAERFWRWTDRSAQFDTQVFADVVSGRELTREEIFGPLVRILRARRRYNAFFTCAAA